MVMDLNKPLTLSIKLCLITQPALIVLWTLKSWCLLQRCAACALLLFFFFCLADNKTGKYIHIVTLKVQNIPENINPTNHPGFVLTELKHKNTIIYLQIFRKQAKFAYLFLWKTMLQPVILFWNVHSVSECLFLFWTVWFRPLAIYPVVFQHQVASWQKTTAYCSHGSEQTNWIRDRRFYPT